jgi:hypothetical protein
MELAAARQYEDAVKKLFPRGDYWDAQFADPESALSLFCKMKAAEILRFRSRMDALCNESLPGSTAEMIDDWERVLLDEIHPELPLARRREFLNAEKPRINKREIRRIGETHSVVVFDISFPRSSAAFPLIHAYLSGEPLSVAKAIVSEMVSGARFGSAKCGASRLAVFSAEYALQLFNETAVCLPFEMDIRSKMLANQITGFQYHIRWEDDDAPQQPAAQPSYSPGVAGTFIGDLTYNTTNFVKEVFYAWYVS